MNDLQVQFITLVVPCPSCGHKQQTSGYTGTTWDYDCTACGAENEVTQPKLTAAHMEQVRRGLVPGASV